MTPETWQQTAREHGLFVVRWADHNDVERVRSATGERVAELLRAERECDVRLFEVLTPTMPTRQSQVPVGKDDDEALIVARLEELAGQ